VSICEKVKKLKNEEFQYEFHFKGFLSGNKITRILVSSPLEKGILKGEEYILYLEIIKIKETVLHTSLLKSKALKNICYVC
jgi:hypothetical protein